MDQHRQWIEHHYSKGWQADFESEPYDENVLLFKKDDFAFHKVEVVFWQSEPYTDENDKPAIITEEFPVQFKSVNVKIKQDFFESEITFHIKVYSPETNTPHEFDLTLAPDETFLPKYKKIILQKFEAELPEKVTSTVLDKLETEVRYTHRHYIKDDEYIPVESGGLPEKYIAKFLKREIEKPIIRWQDRPQLGYEILPNKYFYRYTPPPKADDMLNEFWKLEKDAEELLKGFSEGGV